MYAGRASRTPRGWGHGPYLKQLASQVWLLLPAKLLLGRLCYGLKVGFLAALKLEHPVRRCEGWLLVHSTEGGPCCMACDACTHLRMPPSSTSTLTLLCPPLSATAVAVHAVYTRRGRRRSLVAMAPFPSSARAEGPPPALKTAKILSLTLLERGRAGCVHNCDRVGGA